MAAFCSGASVLGGGRSTRRAVVVGIGGRLWGRKRSTGGDEAMLRRLVDVLGSRKKLIGNEVPEVLAAFSEVTSEELDVHEAEYVGRSSRGSRYAQAITYLHIAERPNFSLGIFVMPPQTTIPLHDHPDMTVYSKVLWGELEVRAYDIVKNLQDHEHSYVAEKHPISVTRGGESRFLTGTNGNVHEFLAKKWTAVFDLSCPPYDNLEGRPCNYYRRVLDEQSEDVLPSPLPSSETTPQAERQLVILEKSNCPSSYMTMRGMYSGIMID